VGFLVGVRQASRHGDDMLAAAHDRAIRKHALPPPPPTDPLGDPSSAQQPRP